LPSLTPEAKVNETDPPSRPQTREEDAVKIQSTDAMLRPSLHGIATVSTFRRWPLATLTEHSHLYCDNSKQESTTMGDG
jgi:hypothetical protein